MGNKWGTMVDGPQGDVLDEIWDEVVSSVRKHPNYPEDQLRRAAITVEEAGEVIQAALDETRVPFDPLGTPLKELRARVYKENVQIAAMAIKHLLAMRGVDMTGKGVYGER